jgi:hypothetical protein
VELFLLVKVGGIGFWAREDAIELPHWLRYAQSECNITVEMREDAVQRSGGRSENRQAFWASVARKNSIPVVYLDAKGSSSVANRPRSSRK